MKWTCSFLLKENLYYIFVSLGRLLVFLSLSCCKHLLSTCQAVLDSLQPHGLQHANCLREFAQIHVHWSGDTIQSSHSLLPLYSSCPQSFPASGPSPMSPLLTSGGQSIGASASVLPMNTQGWFPLGLTGLISLLSKGLSRVFSSTTIWKHQFLGAQPSLLSNSHIHTWLLEKPYLWLDGPLSAK